ncbi:unnamed protein product [Orchesella dallaii]|uniref:Uncharacterized protein n=1 Tax=Orchesella dallaii TaxID=48710 RepID=A0ABP1S541_9HEXA
MCEHKWKFLCFVVTFQVFIFFGRSVTAKEFIAGVSKDDGRSSFRNNYPRLWDPNSGIDSGRDYSNIGFAAEWEYDGPVFDDDIPSTTKRTYEPKEKSKQINHNPVPPRRVGPGTWHDVTGNWWLFGGQGPSATQQRSVADESKIATHFLSDLWVYTPQEDETSSPTAAFTPSKQSSWKLVFRPEGNSENPYSSYPENVDFPLLCGSKNRRHLALYGGHKSNSRASAEASSNSPFSEDNVVWMYDIPRAFQLLRASSESGRSGDGGVGGDDGGKENQKRECNWPSSCNGTEQKVEGLWTSYVCCDACLPDGNTTFEFCPQFSRDPISWCGEDSLMMLQLVIPTPSSSSSQAQGSVSRKKDLAGSSSSSSSYSTSTTTFTSDDMIMSSGSDKSLVERRDDDNVGERDSFNQGNTAGGETSSFLSQNVEGINRNASSKHENIAKNESIQSKLVMRLSGETGRRGNIDGGNGSATNIISQGTPAGRENSAVDLSLMGKEEKGVGQGIEKGTTLTREEHQEQQPLNQDGKSEKMKRNGRDVIKDREKNIGQQQQHDPHSGSSSLNWWKFDLESTEWIKMPEVNIEGELTDSVRNGNCRVVTSSADLVYILCPTKGNLLDRAVLLFDSQKASVRLLGTIHLNNAFTDKKVWQLGRSVLHALPCDNQTIIFLAYHKLLDLWIHDHSSGRLYPVENVWKGSSLHTFQRIASFYKISISLPIPSQKQGKNELYHPHQEGDKEKEESMKKEKKHNTTTHSFFMVNPRSMLANFDDPYPEAHFHITIVPDKEVFLPPRDATYLISSTKFQSDKSFLQNSPPYQDPSEGETHITPPVDFHKVGKMGDESEFKGEGDKEPALSTLTHSQQVPTKSHQNQEPGEQVKVKAKEEKKPFRSSSQSDSRILKLNQAEDEVKIQNYISSTSPPPPSTTERIAAGLGAVEQARIDEHRKNKYRMDIRSSKHAFTKPELLGGSPSRIAGGTASRILAKKRILGIKRTFPEPRNGGGSTMTAAIPEERTTSTKSQIDSGTTTAAGKQPQNTVIMRNNSSVGNLTTDQVQNTNFTSDAATNGYSDKKNATIYLETRGGESSRGSSNHQDTRTINNRVQFSKEAIAKSQQGSVAPATTSTATSATIATTSVGGGAKGNSNEKDIITTTTPNEPNFSGQSEIEKQEQRKKQQRLSTVARSMAIFPLKTGLTEKEQNLMNADRRSSGIMIKERNNGSFSSSLTAPNGKTQTNSNSFPSTAVKAAVNLPARVVGQELPLRRDDISGTIKPSNISTTGEEAVGASHRASLASTPLAPATFNSTRATENSHDVHDHDDHDAVASDVNINQPQEEHHSREESLDNGPVHKERLANGEKEIDQLHSPPAPQLGKSTFTSWNQTSNLSTSLPETKSNMGSSKVSSEALERMPTFIESPEKRATDSTHFQPPAAVTTAAAAAVDNNHHHHHDNNYQHSHHSSTEAGVAKSRNSSKSPLPTEATQGDQSKSETGGFMTHSTNAETSPLIDNSKRTTVAEKNGDEEEPVSPSTANPNSNVTGSRDGDDDDVNHDDNNHHNSRDAEGEIDSPLSPMTYGSSEIMVEPRDDIVHTYGEEGSYAGDAAGYGPTIFFAVSLSFFASIGVVLFVRRCVKCPPRRESVLIKEPPPIRYSVIPDDLSFHHTPIV